jgi:hypothetical protein
MENRRYSPDLNFLIMVDLDSHSRFMTSFAAARGSGNVNECARWRSTGDAVRLSFACRTKTKTPGAAAAIL